MNGLLFVIEQLGTNLQQLSALLRDRDETIVKLQEELAASKEPLDADSR